MNFFVLISVRKYLRDGDDTQAYGELSLYQVPYVHIQSSLRGEFYLLEKHLVYIHILFFRFKSTNRTGVIYCIHWNCHAIIYRSLLMSGVPDKFVIMCAVMEHHVAIDTSLELVSSSQAAIFPSSTRSLLVFRDIYD